MNFFFLEKKIRIKKLNNFIFEQTFNIISGFQIIDQNT